MGFFDRFKKKAVAPDPAAAQQPELAVEEKPAEVPYYSWVAASLRDDSWYLMYRYKKVSYLRVDQNKYYTGKCDIDDIGSMTQDGELIGAVTDKDKVQMIADFLKRGEVVKGIVDGPDSVYIAFYKELYKSLSDCPREIYKLTKTSAKDGVFDCRRYENLDGAENGDRLVLEYNEENQNYLVKDSADGEVGEIGKSDSKKIREKEDE